MQDKFSKRSSKSSSVQSLSSLLGMDENSTTQRNTEDSIPTNMQDYIDQSSDDESC
jgi:hypothetical protein